MGDVIPPQKTTEQASACSVCFTLSVRLLLLGLGRRHEHRLALGHEVVEGDRIAVRCAVDGDRTLADRFHELIPAGEHREASVRVGELEEHEGVLPLAVAGFCPALLDAEVALDLGIGPVGLLLDPVDDLGPAFAVGGGECAGDEEEGQFDLQILLPRLIRAGVEGRHGLGEGPW